MSNRKLIKSAAWRLVSNLKKHQTKQVLLKYRRDICAFVWVRLFAGNPATYYGLKVTTFENVEQYKAFLIALRGSCNN